MIKKIFTLLLVLVLLPCASWATLSPLPPEKAFAFSAQIASGSSLILQWKIAPGYYLYRDRLKISSPSARRFGTIA